MVANCASKRNLSIAEAIRERKRVMDNSTLYARGFYKERKVVRGLSRLGVKHCRDMPLLFSQVHRFTESEIVARRKGFNGYLTHTRTYNA